MQAVAVRYPDGRVTSLATAGVRVLRTQQSPSQLAFAADQQPREVLELIHDMVSRRQARTLIDPLLASLPREPHVPTIVSGVTYSHPGRGPVSVLPWTVMTPDVVAIDLDAWALTNPLAPGHEQAIAVANSLEPQLRAALTVLLTPWRARVSGVPAPADEAAPPTAVVIQFAEGRVTTLVTPGVEVFDTDAMPEDAAAAGSLSAEGLRVIRDLLGRRQQTVVDSTLASPARAAEQRVATVVTGHTTKGFRIIPVANWVASSPEVRVVEVNAQALIDVLADGHEAAVTAVLHLPASLQRGVATLFAPWQSRVQATPALFAPDGAPGIG